MSRASTEIIKAIQRGLAGHLTFVAATKGWGMTSELALYPTIGAVLLAREWEAYCQRKVPGLQSGRGAPCTIDFFARSCSAPQESLAMEVKLLSNGSRANNLNVQNDVIKLRKFSASEGCKDLFLLVVGSKNAFQGRYVLLGNKRIYLEKVPSIIADVGATAWGSVAIKIAP
jgi:hypothetical protein